MLEVLSGPSQEYVTGGNKELPFSCNVKSELTFSRRAPSTHDVQVVTRVYKDQADFVATRATAKL